MKSYQYRFAANALGLLLKCGKNFLVAFVYAVECANGNNTFGKMGQCV